MNKKQQNDIIEQSPQVKKAKQAKNYNEKNIGLDIDKIEYQEIVLSQTNFPDKGYFKQSYYD